MLHTYFWKYCTNNAEIWNTYYFAEVIGLDKQEI